MTEHFSEDDLTLYYYGEGRRRDAIERHLDDVRGLRGAVSRDRGHARDGGRAGGRPSAAISTALEVWQRIRPQVAGTGIEVLGVLEVLEVLGFSGSRGSRRLAAAAALLLIAAFVGGRAWQRAATPVATTAETVEPGEPCEP